VDDAAALTLSAVTDVAVALGYALVGQAIRRRDGPPAARRARLDLALGFWGIAATGVASAALDVAVLSGSRDLAWLGALSNLPLATFAVASAGFAAYLAEVFLGWGRVRPLLFVAYAALAGWNLAAALRWPASRMEIVAWRPVLISPDGQGVTMVATAALLVAPIVVGSLACLVLWGKTPAARARFRLGLTSAGLALWSAASFVITLGATDAAQASGRALVLSSAGLLLVAHAPPRPLEERLAVWERGDAARELARHEREASLGSRVRELV